MDGDLVLYEAAAICLYLTDRHPQARLAPENGSPARAHFYKWLVYLTNTVQAEMMLYFYPERWADNESAAAIVKCHAETRLGAMFDSIEESLARQGPYLLGSGLTAADFYLLVLVRWSRGFDRPARMLPKLRKLSESLAARPAVQRTFASEDIAAPFI